MKTIFFLASVFLGFSALNSFNRTLRNCTFIGSPAWICKARMPSLRAIVSSSVNFAHQVAVDLLRDAIAAGGDVVLVPAALLDELGQFVRTGELFDDFDLVVLADHRLLAAAGQLAAEVFAVAGADVGAGGVHVGLVAADLPFCGTFPTADLHAGVGEAGVGHAELDLQLEVGRLAAPPDEKRVRGAGFSLVVWPVMQPSSTRQKLGSPSQPSSVLPSKIGRKPLASAGRSARAGGKGQRKQHSQAGCQRKRLEAVHSGSPGVRQVKRPQYNAPPQSACKQGRPYGFCGIARFSAQRRLSDRLNLPQDGMLVPSAWQAGPMFSLNQYSNAVGAAGKRVILCLSYLPILRSGL